MNSVLARSAPFLGLLTVICVASPALAATVALAPSKDNTLIQVGAADIQQLSNGQGDIFVGRTNQDGQGAATISIRRGLIAFDVAGSIPAGATITGVSLTMRDVMGLNGDRATTLHRTTADWGEGASFFSGGVGRGLQLAQELQWGMMPLSFALFGAIAGLVCGAIWFRANPRHSKSA